MAYLTNKYRYKYIAATVWRRNLCSIYEKERYEIFFLNHKESSIAVVLNDIRQTKNVYRENVSDNKQIKKKSPFIYIFLKKIKCEVLVMIGFRILIRVF